MPTLTISLYRAGTLARWVHVIVFEHRPSKCFTQELYQYQLSFQGRSLRSSTYLSTLISVTLSMVHAIDERTQPLHEPFRLCNKLSRKATTISCLTSWMGGFNGSSVIFAPPYTELTRGKQHYYFRQTASRKRRTA